MKQSEFKFIEIQPHHFESIVKSNEKFRKLIDLSKPMIIRYMPDLFLCLIHTIISQNNDSAQTDESWNRMKMYIKKITPKSLAKIDKETLMSCGIPDGKINLIRKISFDILINKIDLKKMQNMTDLDILKKLSEYPGIDLWIIQIWLIFGAGHSNVIIFKDPIIIEAIKYSFDVDEVTKNMEEQLFKAFSPNGTILSFILWKIGNDLVANNKENGGEKDER